MAKYITRSATRKTTTENTYDRLLESQQREFLQLMRRESEKLLRDFQEELQRSMREEISSQMKQATQQLGGSAASADGGMFTPSIGGLVSFIGRAINIYASRPRYSETTAESARSRQTLSQFRASRAESLAELSGTLAVAERNS